MGREQADKSGWGEDTRGVEGLSKKRNKKRTHGHQCGDYGGWGAGDGRMHRGNKC